MERTAWPVVVRGTYDVVSGGTIGCIEEIVEVVQLIPQEFVQQMVEVDQIIPQSVSSTETLMCRWRYNAKYQQSGQFGGQWRFFYKCSP